MCVVCMCALRVFLSLLALILLHPSYHFPLPIYMSSLFIFFFLVFSFCSSIYSLSLLAGTFQMGLLSSFAHCLFCAPALFTRTTL